MAAANKAGKAALKQLLGKLNAYVSRREAPSSFTSRNLEGLLAFGGVVEGRIGICSGPGNDGAFDSYAPAVKEGWSDTRLASPVVRIGIMDQTRTGLWC